MKFLNFRKKLKNSALAVLFAVAVMFVMPAAVFADNTDTDALNIVANSGTENDIDHNDNVDSTIGFDAESPAVTEDIADHTENTEPELTDPLIPSDNCHGICCSACDENCDGTCCDMCTINKSADDVNVSDNSEYGLGDGFTAGTDVPAGNGSEESGFGNSYGEITGGSINSNEDIMPPVFPAEPIFPDDYYNNVTDPENPEYVYQPDGNDPAEEGSDKDRDNENEGEIIYDDLTGGEDEIIYGDDSDAEKSEAPDAPNSSSEDSDNASNEPGEDKESPDNSDEENSDNTTDEENNDNSDNEENKDDTDISDSENSDNADGSDDAAGEEISDSGNTDNITDKDDPDNSDIAAGEEDSDSSDEEASDNAADAEDPDASDEEEEEDDNPVINVVLPVSISVAINPYNLKVADDNGFHYSISSPEYSIKNYSNCDVSIVAAVSASTEGGIILSPYDLNGNETEFTAFAYLEATNESGVYSDNYNNGANQIAFSNEAVSKEILTLADGSNGETVGYFRIKGQAVLPDGAQYSDQAMLNMVITFDIDPVGKSVVPDDAVEEDPENGDNTENSEGIENTEGSENAENTQNSESIENTEGSENAENTQNSESIENTESSENVENVEISENIENTENPQELAV